MLINWSEEEREAATRGDVNIFILNTSPQAIKEMDKELPTDTHIIEYVLANIKKGFKLKNIFFLNIKIFLFLKHLRYLL